MTPTMPPACAFTTWLAECDRICRSAFGIPADSHIDPVAWRPGFDAGLAPLAAIKKVLNDNAR